MIFAIALTNFPGGYRVVGRRLETAKQEKDIKRAIDIVREKFATVDGFGPGQVVEFLDSPERDGQEMQARRAFEWVQKLLGLL